MLNAFGSPRNLDKRRLQLAKTTGVVQAAGDGVVQAAHRHSWCFFVELNKKIAKVLVRILYTSINITSYVDFSNIFYIFQMKYRTIKLEVSRKVKYQPLTVVLTAGASL